MLPLRIRSANAVDTFGAVLRCSLRSALLRQATLVVFTSWCMVSIQFFFLTFLAFACYDAHESAVLHVHMKLISVFCHLPWEQERHAVARKPRDAAAVLFGLKFADNIHYKFKSSQASKARLQSSKHTGAKQNLTQNGHSRSFKVTKLFQLTHYRCLYSV